MYGSSKLRWLGRATLPNNSTLKRLAIGSPKTSMLRRKYQPAEANDPAAATTRNVRARIGWTRARNATAMAIVGNRKTVWIFATTAAPAHRPMAPASANGNAGRCQMVSSRPMVAALSRLASVSLVNAAAR